MSGKGSKTHSKTIDLSSKKISSTDSLDPLPPSSGRVKLLLNNNCIESLPAEWISMSYSQLCSLSLAKNNLVEIPSHISLLVSLEKLDVSNNKIKTVSPSISKLSSLRKLDMTSNALHSFPESVSLLSSLQILCMSKNKIRSVPLSILDLSNLNTLELTGNPLVFPPASVVPKGCNAILTFLRSSLNMPGLPITEFKNLNRNPYHTSVTTPNLFSPETSRKNPKILYQPKEDTGTPTGSSFLVTHTVFSDQGCREYMEDAYVAFNHITLTSGPRLTRSLSGTPVKPARDSSPEPSPNQMESVTSETENATASEIPSDTETNGHSEYEKDETESKLPKLSLISSSSQSALTTNGSSNLPNGTEEPTKKLKYRKSDDRRHHKKEKESGRLSPSSKQTGDITSASSSELSDSSPRRRQRSESIAYYGVYDGHAGGRCSAYIKEHLHQYFFQMPDAKHGQIPKALYKAFLRAEKHYSHTARSHGWNDGSTAVVCVIHGTNLNVAHVGDSRAVLCRGKDAIQLTSDHKPDRPDEEQRILSLGGTVSKNAHTGYVARVNGHLAVSRAFGDLRMKEGAALVSAEPEINVFSLQPDDHFIILASDGLWDVVSNQEAVNIVRKYPQTHKASEHLTKRALKLGSADNITIIIVWLSWLNDDQVQATATTNQ